MTRIPVDKKYLQGAISIQRHENAIQPWRYPYQEHGLFSAYGELANRANKTAGVRISFRTNSPMVELEAGFDMLEEPESFISLSHDNEFVSKHRLTPGKTLWCFELPGEGMCNYEIWLPIFAESRLRSLAIADGYTLEPAEDLRLKWLTYGSSITHCRASYDPCLTWPAVTARKLNLNLTSLGYGGQCHLEAGIGRVIRDTPADVITMKLGINVYGNSSLNLRTFCPAVIGLVQLIREKHPNTPIGLITPIFSCERETTRNSVGMTLEDYRAELRRAWNALKTQGDSKVFIFEGMELLHSQEGHLLPDGLHPEVEGYVLMGERVAEKILPVLLAARH